MAVPKALRFTLLSLRDLRVSAGPFVLAAVALVALAYLLRDGRADLGFVQGGSNERATRDETGHRAVAAGGDTGHDGAARRWTGSWDALQRQVARIVVPPSCADELYALRNNINLVRRQLMAPTD